MFCNKCGSQLTEGAKFCRACGQPISSASTTATPNLSDAPTADITAEAAQVTGQIPYRPSPEAPTAGKALGSLISGIVGLTVVPVIASIIAVVLGHLGLSEIKKSAGRLKGEGMAIAGLVMGYLGLALIPIVFIIAAIAIPNLLRARIAVTETSAINTIRQINAAEASYSAEHPDKGFTCSIDDLNVMNRENATKNGYNFILRNCESEISDGPVVRYKVVALPLDRSTTRRKTYCSDESGVISSIKEGSSDDCLTEGVPLQ